MKASDRQEGGQHYKDFPIQPAEFCQRNRLNWCEANVVKYTCRHAKKNGLEDLRKAMHYLELLAEFEYGASLKSERKASLCHSCDINTPCHLERIKDCEETGTCTHFVSALRERMLDAKQEVTCSQAKCTLEEIAECACTAKQDAPKTAELAPTHTDPATNCKDCGNTLCVGVGRDLTCDQGCERFTPKGEL